MSVSLQKGQKVSLTKDNAGLSQIVAVSYTHLDVYKRQGFGWSRGFSTSL